MAIQCEPVMTDNSCQTHETLATSPPRFISITLRDVCLAVQHDHSYASADNPLPNEKRTSLTEDPKRALEFRENKSVNRDFNEELKSNVNSVIYQMRNPKLLT